MSSSVALTPQGIAIDGQPTFLYGGELQYFRVRDPGGDVARTHALWERGLDAMQAAGMNLLTSYIPWDVHEPEPGRFVFEGLADVERFFELACQRGFSICAKPGPFINAEWPTGIGTFGAVPDWFRRRHPGSLVRRPNGRPWSFHPLDSGQSQPSYLDPHFLARVRAWFAALAPRLRPFLQRRPGVVLLQLDNETNQFFASRTELDFHPSALAHYRAWLRETWGEIAALNARYGSHYTSFQQVRPPRRWPRNPRDNARHRDAYAAAQACVGDFLAHLRGCWEELGIGEPDVLFTTNDSPHLFPGRQHLLWDAEVKNRSGVACLDLYPRQLPWGKRPLDLPFLCEGWTHLFAQGAARQGGAVALSAELQGGIFELPVGRIPVSVETTEQVLCKTVGHGLVMASIYVLHGGLNRDGKPYDFQAAIAPDGTTRPRYAMLQRWGTRLLKPHGARLLASRALKDAALIVYDPDLQAPRVTGGLHPPRLAADAHGALFGWMAAAGFAPELADLRGLSAEALARHKAVLWLNTGQLRPAWAKLLADYVHGGGTLISFGLSELKTPDGQPLPELQDLYAVQRREPLRWWLGSGSVEAVCGADSHMVTSWGLRERCLPADEARPFLWERRWLRAPACLGFERRVGKGRLLHLGALPFVGFGGPAWYGFSDTELAGQRALCSWLMQQAGVGRSLDCATPHGLVWGRRVAEEQGGGLFLFVINDGKTPGLLVRFVAAEALGISGTGSYRCQALLAGKELRLRTGESLLRAGLQLELPRFACEVLWLRPVGG